MTTLILEVVKSDSCNVGFYNPSPESFRAYPRTIDGVKKAVKGFKKLLDALENVEDYRIAVYEGKKEYYNKKPFIGYISKDTIVSDF